MNLAFVSIWSGVIRVELYSLTLGPISHSCWLTLFVRILLLFMKVQKSKGNNNKNLLVHCDLHASKMLGLLRVPSTCTSRHISPSSRSILCSPLPGTTLPRMPTGFTFSFYCCLCWVDQNQTICSKAVDKILKACVETLTVEMIVPALLQMLSQ